MIGQHCLFSSALPSATVTLILRVEKEQHPVPGKLTQKQGDENTDPSLVMSGAQAWALPSVGSEGSWS